MIENLEATPTGQVIRAIRALRERAEHTPDPEAWNLHKLASIRQEVEDTIGRAVTEMHENGRTWAEIATALGVSPQAAHKRYGA